MAELADILHTLVLDFLGPVLGQDRLSWMQDGARGLVGTRTALWWLVSWSTTLLLVFSMLVRAYKRRPFRVPHPNKTVAKGQPEVIIVGSGILGSSLATVLGKDGRRVTVIERDMKEPDRIVGEILQPGGVSALRKMDMEDCLEGIDSPHYRGYIVWDMDYTKRYAHIPVPSKYVDGRGFHHGRFIQQLRKAAMAEDKVTYIEGVVLEILEEGGAVVGVRYRRKGTEIEEVLKAPLVVVADGIYSKFRKDYTNTPPDPQAVLCGLMMHNAEQALDKHMELVVAEPSFVITYKVSSTCTRALVDLPPSYAEMPTDLKAYLKEAVYPKMPANLAGPFLEAVEAGGYRNQVLNFLPANPAFKPGVIVLGDALNVRHALTGGGMTCALNDSVLARAMLRKVPDLYDYSAVMNLYRKLVVDRKTVTSSVNVTAFFLYHIYASTDYHVKKLKRGLFAFSEKPGFGNKSAGGTISILYQPYFPLTEFILSLVYAIALNFREEGLLRFPLALYDGMIMFIKAFRLAAPYVQGEAKTDY